MCAPIYTDINSSKSDKNEIHAFTALYTYAYHVLRIVVLNQATIGRR